MALHIFLDTETLRRDPTRRSGPFIALAYLASKKLVSLHISDLTVSEFLSSLEISIAAARDKTLSGLRALAKSTTSASQLRRFRRLASACTKEAATTLRHAQRDFKEWRSALQVKVHRMAAGHATNAFEAYFAGSPPFRERKRREDLPDAFIWEAAKKVARQHGQLLFVSADGGFKHAGELESQIQVFSTVAELLQLPELATPLTEGIIASQLELLKQIFEPWAEGKDQVRQVLANELLGRRVLFFFPIEGYYQIRRVTGVERLFTEGLPRYYAEGVLTIQISGRATCELSMPDATTTPIEKATADSELLARTLVFAGIMRLALDPHVLGHLVSPDELFTALDRASIGLDELTLHWESGETKIDQQVFQRHAFDEAERQIEDGDDDTTIDEAEEANRLGRARWVPVPEQFLGKHGKFVIKEGAQLKIAPMPRFEHWVKMLKRILLDKQGGNS